MTERISELARRLVVGHKSDGRSVYDEQAKRELIDLYHEGGISIAKLARACAVNANLLTSWIHGRGRRGTNQVTGEVVDIAGMPPAFVPVKIEAPVTAEPAAVQVALQARLPNGVVLDLREIELRHVGDIVDALGRLRCSASTKG